MKLLDMIDNNFKDEIRLKKGILNVLIQKKGGVYLELVQSGQASGGVEYCNKT